MKFILLNGPPGSGKDTVGELLLAQMSDKPVRIKKFADPLKKGAAGLYLGGDYEEFKRYDSPGLKDCPCEAFGDLTPRQAQINLSEKFLKPIHGDDIFGKIFVNTLDGDPELDDDIVIVTDSGFLSESTYLVKQATAKNVTLVRIHREGKNFDNDSRSYIDLTSLGVDCIDIHNNEGSPGRTAFELYNILKLRGVINDQLHNEPVHQRRRENGRSMHP